MDIQTSGSLMKYSMNRLDLTPQRAQRTQRVAIKFFALFASFAVNSLYAAAAHKLMLNFVVNYYRSHKNSYMIGEKRR